MFGLFKILLTDAAATVSGDRGALAALDQRIQDAMRAHLESRRALALAVAEGARESDRRAALADRIADLENRAVAALRGTRDDLALAAAETIASLETELIAARDAAAVYAEEIAKLRRTVEAQRRRLADLDRGRRLARVSAALSPPGRSVGVNGDSLDVAERALVTLRARQADQAAVAASLATPDAGIAEDLAEAGFGSPLRPRAGDVLDRLRSRMAHADLAIADR